MEFLSATENDDDAGGVSSAGSPGWKQESRGLDGKIEIELTYK